jgi:maltooligosyltrehalose trehalohydrolase
MQPIECRDDLKLGAHPLDGGRCRFRVWAPRAKAVAVRLIGPPERTAPLAPGEFGYHEAVIDGVAPGSLYLYRLDDDLERPDPASRSQPQGVHGPSQVVGLDFPWTDAGWNGLPLYEQVIYELHVGTFTPEGTFDAVIPHLDYLKNLGVTTVELMPVSQCPGERNWGYDGVYPFAAQHSYGGPAGLMRLVDACHAKGLAVALDVVYNHLGPEGNYLRDFGPYFTADYHTPWGEALNYDGPHADDVRRFFLENILHWVVEFHIDMLRLDATDAILDRTAYPFLAETADLLHTHIERPRRHVHLVAETSHNDPQLVRPHDRGGVGLDGQWNDDFHHALRVLLTGDRSGYYVDFGTVDDLARAYRDGFVRAGRYSHYFKRRHGRPAPDVEPFRFVAFSQNHDQVGNRARSDRLSTIVPFEALKLAAGAVILSPFVPMLFMGEEYGEPAPFHYFIDHGDPALIEAVRRGRSAEFAHFMGGGAPADPQSPATRDHSRLDHSLRTAGPEKHRRLFAFYQELIHLRKTVTGLRDFDKAHVRATASEDDKLLVVERGAGDDQTLCLMYFGDGPAAVTPVLPAGAWAKRLDSGDGRWGGPGSDLPYHLDGGSAPLSLLPWQLALYERAAGE